MSAAFLLAGLDLDRRRSRQLGWRNALVAVACLARGVLVVLAATRCMVYL